MTCTWKTQISSWKQSNRRHFCRKNVRFKISWNLIRKLYRGGGNNSSQLTTFCWQMDVFYVVAVIQTYSGLNLCSPFKKTLWGEFPLWVFVTAWIQKHPCVRWTTCTLTVDLLVMVIHTWTVCYATLRCFFYRKFCTTRLVVCVQRRRKDRVVAIWLDED